MKLTARGPQRSHNRKIVKPEVPIVPVGQDSREDNIQVVKPVSEAVIPPKSVLERIKKTRTRTKVLAGVAAAGIIAAGVAVPSIASANRTPRADNSSAAPVEPGTTTNEQSSAAVSAPEGSVVENGRVFSAGKLDTATPLFAAYETGSALTKADVEILLHNIDTAVTNTYPENGNYDYDSLAYSGVNGTLARNLLSADSDSVTAYYFSLNRDVAGGFSQKVFDDCIAIDGMTVAGDGTPAYDVTAYISAASDFTRENFGQPSFFKENLSIGVKTVENPETGTSESVWVIQSIQDAEKITLSEWNAGIE